MTCFALTTGGKPAACAPGGERTRVPSVAVTTARPRTRANEKIPPTDTSYTARKRLVESVGNARPPRSNRSSVDPGAVVRGAVCRSGGQRFDIWAGDDRVDKSPRPANIRIGEVDLGRHAP